MKRSIETDSTEDASSQNNAPRVPCKYGRNCYRKNPAHFKEFTHPGEDTAVSSDSLNKGQNPQEDKYSFYLSKVSGIDDCYNTSALSLRDILSPPISEDIQQAYFFNYMFELSWILEQFPTYSRKIPIFLIHGDTDGQLENEARKTDNITVLRARLEFPFGTHHSKMIILIYKCGIRVVIVTANFIFGDWNQKTQGIWLSPIFPQSASDKAVDSRTEFRKDLIDYLTSYKNNRLKDLIDLIKEHDFSQARVFLISSVPGRHKGSDMRKYGLLKVRSILAKHSKIDYTKAYLIGQFSSVGSLGKDPSSWLLSHFKQSLLSGTSAGDKIKLIFPAVEDVRLSLEGYSAGGSIPYSRKTAENQPYLTKFFHRWRADNVGRTLASPHIKSYMVVENSTPNSVCWFLLTSANLSKAAWGAFEKNESQLFIRSYELGVLFLPEFFDEDCFHIRGKAHPNGFLVPYDVPPKPYEKGDRAWLWDVSYVDKPDSHGRYWRI